MRGGGGGGGVRKRGQHHFDSRDGMTASHAGNAYKTNATLATANASTWCQIHIIHTVCLSYDPLFTWRMALFTLTHTQLALPEQQ